VERRGFLREFILGATNAIGTKHMIRLQEKAKIQFRMVFFSSAEVYGDYEGVMTEDVMEKNPIRFRHLSDE
jgi:dTDP-glucose 4,6-dehydratase